MARTGPKLGEIVRHRIRELRDERGLTQEQLCERAGISADAISRIEGGSRVPTLETLERLSSAFAVNPAVLFQGATRPMERPPTAARRIQSLLDGQPDRIQRLAVSVVSAIVGAFRVGAATGPRSVEDGRARIGRRDGVRAHLRGTGDLARCKTEPD